MTRVGILSDTHGWFDDRMAYHLASCDEIWHAGDIGSMQVVEKLQAIAPLQAVHGNIDGGDVRRLFHAKLRWRCEDAEILMTHIGGYPGRYDRSVVEQLTNRPPHLFISGHSHILKVQYDDKLRLLHINPGAAGRQGWQTVRTMVRLTVDGSRFRDLEVIELTSV